MTLTAPPSLYNQSFLSDADFVSNFVARKGVLQTLRRRLDEIGATGDSQHQTLIGARGMGKTSLLRRVAIEIADSSELSACFIPLMFREEQYNVLHLRDFWQNCGEALADWAEARGDTELAARLDAALCSPAWSGDSGAADGFSAEMRALGKRAVLLVDNLDLIIDALKDKDRWTLRSSLQMRGGPILIGAATQPLKESADRRAAFYEFFHPVYLEPLSLPEMERCMRALAHGRGDAGKRVLTILRTDPARLKVMHPLTGGNPRVLAMTYRFLETADTHDAMGDLERLLDEVTPYYKARIEEYQTPLQRAVIDAIALHWDPVTTGELSEITGQPTTTLSSQLNRLRKDGLIETVETSGSYSGHQIVERFLNIWYLMRHGTRRNKQRMRWLVAFLSSFYSSKELALIDQEAKASGLAERWTKDYADAFAEARRNAATTGPEPILPSPQSAMEYEQSGESPEGIVHDARALFKKGYDLGQTGDPEAEIETYDGLIARFGESDQPALMEQVARAMLGKGITLGQTGDLAPAVETYDGLIARFGESDQPALMKQVARAMLYKGVALDQTGDLAAAIETYDRLIARFGESAQPAVMEQVARAMLGKGITLGQTGDLAAEIETYDGVIARFGESDQPAVMEPVAWAMRNKGITLGQTGDLAAAISWLEQSLNLMRTLQSVYAAEETTSTAIRLANSLIDMGIDTNRAETLLKEAAEHEPLLANANLFWLYLSTDRTNDAKVIVSKLDTLPSVGRALIDAALALDAENLGTATTHIEKALSPGLSDDTLNFEGDFERLLRLALERGYGERLITWFEETRFSDRYAPIYVALVAAVRGERTLLDSNPEVRQAASVIHSRLIAGNRT